jgi:hypothetical protein
MTEIDALQESLTAEHAACYGYGVLGGVLAGIAPGGADDVRAAEDYQAHRALRDQLADLITSLGADPVAAMAAYEMPFAVQSADSCRRLARFLENRCATVDAYAVAETTGDSRAVVAGALGDAALRAFGWGAAPEPFPGLDRT